MQFKICIGLFLSGGVTDKRTLYKSEKLDSENVRVPAIGAMKSL